jgi:hypothetical protein
MKPSEASIATRPWTSSDSRQRRTSRTDALPRKSARRLVGGGGGRVGVRGRAGRAREGVVRAGGGSGRRRRAPVRRWLGGRGARAPRGRSVRAQFGRRAAPQRPGVGGGSGTRSRVATHWRGRTGWGRARRCRAGSGRLWGGGGVQGPRGVSGGASPRGAGCGGLRAMPIACGERLGRGAGARAGAGAEICSREGAAALWGGRPRRPRRPAAPPIARDGALTMIQAQWACGRGRAGAARAQRRGGCPPTHTRGPTWGPCRRRCPRRSCDRPRCGRPRWCGRRSC